MLLFFLPSFLRSFLILFSSLLVVFLLSVDAGRVDAGSIESVEMSAAAIGSISTPRNDSLILIIYGLVKVKVELCIGVTQY